MKDLKTEAENIRSDINREIDKADSGSMVNDKQGLTGGITTVTGTASRPQLRGVRC